MLTHLYNVLSFVYFKLLVLLLNFLAYYCSTETCYTIVKNGHHLLMTSFWKGFFSGVVIFFRGRAKKSRDYLRDNKSVIQKIPRAAL